LETKLNSLRFLNLTFFIRVWWTLQSACFTLTRNCFGQVLSISFWLVLLKQVSTWKWTCLQQNVCSQLESQDGPPNSLTYISIYQPKGYELLVYM